MLSTFSYICWPFICLLWRNVYSSPLPIFKTKFILFIYFWLRWVFVAERGLSLVEASEGYSVVVHGLLIAVASLIAEHDL